MITLYRPSGYDSPRASSFAGRSVDDKPLDVENGSSFREIDTGRIFRYDKENNLWIEQKGATPVQPAKPEQAKTVDLNMATGNQTVLPDEGMTLSSATIIKPDTMIPENIKVGINIGGVVGAAPTPKVEQTKTVDLAMAAGNQTISPDEGKVLSSVVVTKPTTLVAENIKKDVNIGGVVGTLEGGTSANPTATAKAVNFRDYDGTVLYSYTVEEAAALTELPPLPEHSGLVCQGWNWSLDDIKAMGRAVEVGAMYITDDGKTRIYIHLEDGRTSPMLGCCPNGTVTVDWGDGTEPDTLTGTSTTTVKWTPTHEYGAAGDYVIKLTVSGSVSFAGYDSSNAYSYLLRYSISGDSRNQVYQNAIQKVEIGGGVTSIGSYAFYCCYSLSSIVIPNSVTSISEFTFDGCYSLSSIVIPNSVTSISEFTFNSCYSLSSITIPDSVTSIGTYAFGYCYSLSSITIPDSVTSIGSYVFGYCYSLSAITIPVGVTSIDSSAFNSCRSLSSITIPDSVTSIGSSAFNSCYSLSSITIPVGVTSISSNVFNGCYGVNYYDFARHTAVPTLSNTNAFNKISADCEIRVPAALVDEWKAATNWATYADKIVGV